MVRDLAARYYSLFFFGSAEGKLKLTLSEHAPEEVRTLVRKVCGENPTQESLACLYECLCSLAERDALIAPEKCTEDLVPIVDGYLRNRLATNA